MFSCSTTRGICVPRPGIKPMSSVERWVLSHWTTREVLAQPLSGLQIMSLRHLHEHKSGLRDNVPEPANTQKTIWPWPSWLSFTFSAHCAHLLVCHRVQRHQWFSVSRLHHNFLACPHSHLFHYLFLLWKQHCGYWRKCADGIARTSGISDHLPSSHWSHPAHGNNCFQATKFLKEENIWIGVLFASKALMQLLVNPFMGPLTNRYLDGCSTI